MLLPYPRNEKFFMVCFSFAEGPLAWALIVWRCSLVFSSVDKIVRVLIHLLPVKLNANRVVISTLRGFDQFMNLVIDNTVEFNGNLFIEFGGIFLALIPIINYMC